MKFNFKNSSYEDGGENWVKYKHDLNNDYAITSCTVEIRSGRYPNVGSIYNQRSSELLFVAEGRGTFKSKGETRTLTEGDVVFISPGEKYYWENVSNLVLHIVHTPPWSSSDQKHIFE